MTSTAASAELARGLHQLAQTSLGFFPPVHIVVRLSYALGQDQDVIYLEGQPLGSADADADGRLIAMTRRFIHIVDFSDVPRSGKHGDEGGRVTVTTLPRTALIKVEVPDTGKHEAWSPMVLGAPSWPGQLSLTYAGYPQPVMLLGRRSGGPLFELHDSLLEDLAA